MMKKLILSILCILVFGLSAQAQFLKKLKNKVEQKVENRVTKNVSDKAANETDKSLNKMWQKSLEKTPMPMGGERVDISEIPETYTFDWIYTMEIQTGQGNMDMAYYLKKDAPYFGINMQDAGGLFMVLDDEKKLSIMYFNSEGNKLLMATKTDEEDLLEEDESFYDDYQIEEIEGKTILGYDCKGYKAENEEHLMKFYVTKDAPVTLIGIRQEKNTQLPKGFNADWFKEGNSLMMEMEMKNKKDPAKNAKMLCTSLEEKRLTINKNDYNSM